MVLVFGIVRTFLTDKSEIVQLTDVSVPSIVPGIISKQALGSTCGGHRFPAEFGQMD